MGSSGRERNVGARGFGSGRAVEESKNPAPSLAGPFNSSWSVPPQCEYATGTALRGHFSSVKSGLNKLGRMGLR